MTTQTSLQQDSAFYTNEAGHEIVWENPTNTRFYVIRNGEMRIHATDSNGDRIVIRYTDQLEAFGIKTDEDLAKWTEADEELFCWVNNSWFEVMDLTEPNWTSEVFDTLDDAKNYAVELFEEYGDDKEIV